MKTEAIYEHLALLQLALANPGARKEKKSTAIVLTKDQEDRLAENPDNKIVRDPVNWEDGWFANYE